MNLVNLAQFRRDKNFQTVMKLLNRKLADQKMYLPQHIPDAVFEQVCSYAKFGINIHNHSTIYDSEEFFRIFFKSACDNIYPNLGSAGNDLCTAFFTMYCQAMVFEEQRRLNKIEFPFQFSDHNIFDADFQYNIGQKYKNMFHYFEFEEELKCFEDLVFKIKNSEIKIPIVPKDDSNFVFADPNIGLPVDDLIDKLSDHLVKKLFVTLPGNYLTLLTASYETKVVLNTNRSAYMVFEPLSYLQSMPQLMHEIIFSGKMKEILENISILRTSLKEFYKMQSEAFLSFANYLKLEFLRKSDIYFVKHI